MQDRAEIIVPLSKLKIVFLIVGSIVLVVGGMWLTTLDAEQIQSSRRMNNPQFVYAIGYVCVVLFGLCGIYGIFKLFDTRPGLILNCEGITDNSSAVAAGLIPWSEITGFSEFQVKGTKMLIIHVLEPEKYVNRGNKMKRALNKATMNMVGSPISISSAALGISYPKVLEIIESSFKQHTLGRG